VIGRIPGVVRRLGGGAEVEADTGGEIVRRDRVEVEGTVVDVAVVGGGEVAVMIAIVAGVLLTRGVGVVIAAGEDDRGVNARTLSLEESEDLENSTN